MTSMMCFTAIGIFFAVCFIGVTFLALTAPHGVEDDEGFHEVE